MSGQRQVAFVTGEPGIGKTRLVNAFLERARSRGALFISVGQCIDQYGKGEPYMPVLEALDNLCRGPDAEEVIGVLRRMAPSWLLQMPGLIPGTEVTSTVSGTSRDSWLNVAQPPSWSSTPFSTQPSTTRHMKSGLPVVRVRSIWLSCGGRSRVANRRPRYSAMARSSK